MAPLRLPTPAGGMPPGNEPGPQIRSGRTLQGPPAADDALEAWQHPRSRDPRRLFDASIGAEAGDRDRVSAARRFRCDNRSACSAAPSPTEHECPAAEHVVAHPLAAMYLKPGVPHGLPLR